MIYLGTNNDMIDPAETTVIHDYVSDLIDKVKEYKSCNTIVPFRITSIKETEFVVKVSGLYAYINFKHMPWRYSHISEWHAIAPKLISKTFLCQIYEINENPLNIKIYGEIPQFQKPCFLLDQKYKGIITRKFHDGIFLDLGYHFDWQCGSIISPIFKNNIIQEEVSKNSDEIQTFDELEVGQIFEVSYWGIDNRNNKILGNDIEQKKWNTGEIIEYRKQLIKVTVTVKQGKENIYSVEQTNDAEMPIIKLIYGFKTETIKKAITLLKNQDIITCEVSRILTEKRKFLLKWNDYEEIRNILSREEKIDIPQKELTQINDTHETTIKNFSETENSLIGSIVTIEVKKTLDITRHISNIYHIKNTNEYTSQLYIYNPNYRITKHEKHNIEKSLEHDTILECKVITIEDGIIILRWNISDKELKTFLK